MKIKIITLFNKIANNEKVPKKIKFRGETYYYSDADKFYYQNGFSMYRDFYWGGNCLNDEVEIIEEEKEIEKMNALHQSVTIANHYSKENTQCIVNEFYRRIAVLVDKYNELVDEINKLKKEIEKENR